MDVILNIELPSPQVKTHIQSPHALTINPAPFLYATNVLSKPKCPTIDVSDPVPTTTLPYRTGQMNGRMGGCVCGGCFLRSCMCVCVCVRTMNNFKNSVERAGRQIGEWADERAGRRGAGWPC